MNFKPMETQTVARSKISTTTITGSEALVHCLVAEGADLIYGYPGGAIMPFYG